MWLGWKTFVICLHSEVSKQILMIFSSPGRSPGRAIVLPPASTLASALAKQSFYVKVFYVMGKALSGELSCPCDRSCLCTKVEKVSHT